ncbi:MAG: DUF2232 domain-containing protein [Synergistaceae bacterium]|nr:DUF2232 domain-containing protein [Synergistaceae bacterium]
MKKIIPCVIITLALILAGFFLPGLGFLGIILCPLPLAVLGCLEGRRVMSIAEITIEVLLFISLSPSMAIYFLLGCAPLSAIIFSCSRIEFKEAKKLTGADSLLISTGTDIIFKLILLVGFYAFTGRNILFPSNVEIAMSLIKIYGDNPEIHKAIIRIAAIYPYLLPMMLFIYASFESFFNYVLCGRLVKKFSKDAKNFPPALPEFKFWRFPPSLLFISILSFVAGYLIKSESWFAGSMFILNLQLVINIFFFIEGLALTFWIMDGFKLKRGARIFICLILAIPFFWAWLVIIGMCDQALNLRTRIKFKS